MIFIKKLKFLPSLFFFEKDLDKMLKDLLEKKTLIWCLMMF